MGKVLAAMALVVVVAIAVAVAGRGAGETPIKVGVLHSLTGTMSVSERGVVDATLMAIEEVNAAGGLLGRPVKAVLADGRSDPETFAVEAERLIQGEKVATIFGCWTSASRKTVRPVVEWFDNLLVYPVQYEGLEQSSHILYMGAAPNQQIIPAVRWAMARLGARRFFLVGSDYVFPHTANAIIRDHVGQLKGEVVGEAYLPVAGGDAGPIVEAIAAAAPDVILNTINGDGNAAFFAALRARGIHPAQTPTLSFSIGEAELAEWKGAAMAGDFAAWNYFQSLDSPANVRFAKAFAARYGAGRPITDPMEAAYVGVHLWAQAVAEAGTDDPRAIRSRIGRQSYPAPEGLVYVDAATRHAWKTVRIGRIRDNGQFEVVWDSGTPVQPQPYPRSRSREEWDTFLAKLQMRWGGWANRAGSTTP